MKRLKILFQEPFIPRQVIYGKFAAGTGNNTFPYGVASIASYINERGFPPEYLDPNISGLSEDEYASFLRQNRFNVIAMSATTLEIDYVIKTFELVKRVLPDVVTVLGGVHATLLPEEVLGKSDSIDYVVTGEGEKIFLRILECLHADEIIKIKHIPGIAFQEGRRTVVNPYDNSYRLSETELPIPLFEIFPMKEYVAQATYSKVFPTFSTIASRGCPYDCAFCAANITTGKNVRYKPVPSIIHEIRTLKEHYGARGIMFLDSTFTLDPGWVRDFCTAYIASGLNLPWACNSRVDTIDEDLLILMKKAGAWSVLFGLESANQRSLDLIGKETTVEQNRSAVRLALKLGFYVYTSYILGLPGENEKDVMNTIRFARSLGNHLCIFYLPVPFPKTRLELIAKKEGGLSENINSTDYNQWDYSNPVYINPLIGNKKMQSLLKKAFLTFYTNPVVIMRNLKELLLLRQSPYKFWLGLRGLNGFFRR